MRRFPLLATALFCSTFWVPFGAAPAAADELLKDGPELLVNTYTTGPQGFPEIAVTGTGEYVVTWESAPQDGSDFGVYAQRFAADGTKIGPELQVNTYTTGTQWDPSVAVDGAGNFVVAWHGDGGNPSFDVFARRFDASGSPLGDQFQVNTFTTDYQGNTSVASAADGGFLVVWESDTQDQSDGGVYGQVYNAAGMPLGGEIRINDTTAADQNDVRVAAVSDGFAVTWESFLQDGSEESAILRFLDSTGAPASGEIVVNSHTPGDQEDVALAVSAEGHLAVVWESDAQDGFGEGVYGQVLDANGSPIGPELQLNTYTTQDQDDPRVAPDGTGGFVAVWSSEDQVDGVSYDLFGQRFDAAGQLVGGEFQVNTQATDDQDFPVVAGGPGQRFMVVWRSFGATDDDFAGVVAQRFEIAIFADGFESGDTSEWTSVSP